MGRLGIKIKEARTKKGITAKQLAKTVGLSENYILDVEYGRKVLNDDMVKKISKALELEITEQISDSYDEEKESRNTLKSRIPVKNTPQEIQEVWNDAFESVLKTIPIYEYDLSKVVATKQLPVISNKIEGYSKDKVFYIKICDNDLSGFRIVKDDIALATATSEIKSNSFYLIEFDNQRIIRQIKKLDKDRLLLINNGSTLRANTVSSSDIKVLAQLLKLEIIL